MPAISADNPRYITPEPGVRAGGGKEKRAPAKKRRFGPFDVLMYACLIFFAVLYIFPIYFTLTSAFKDDFHIFYTPFSLPEKLSFDNFVRAWGMSRVSTYFLNSVILTASVCALLLIFSSMASFILSKFKFRWLSKLFIFFIAGMMIPVQSTIIPLSLVVSTLGIKNNLFFVVLIMVAFELPLNILILTSFMRSVPDALVESATIDGCSIVQTFLRIILPLSVPAIVTLMIMDFISAWNAYFLPFVFINKSEHQPLAVGLLAFFGQRNTDFSGVMAAIVISISPPLLVYIFTQEKIERGIITGALKG